MAEYIKKVGTNETLFQKHTKWKRLPQSKWSKVRQRSRFNKRACVFLATQTLNPVFFTT
jgi:hypothetical protein